MYITILHNNLLACQIAVAPHARLSEIIDITAHSFAEDNLAHFGGDSNTHTLTDEGRD